MQSWTFNNIVNLLKTFADNHYQIKRFGSGEISDVETLISDSEEFPIVWVRLNSITYPTGSNGSNIKVFDFNILIFDILKNDKSNEQEIISDTNLIGEDYIRFLYNQDETLFTIINTPRIEPFTERFTDFVAGVNLSLAIEVDFEGQNDCDLPAQFPTFEFSIPSGGGDCECNITIGDPVISGNPTEVLYIDNNGDLFSDSNFNRDSVTNDTTIQRLSTESSGVEFLGSGVDDMSVDFSSVDNTLSITIRFSTTSDTPDKFSWFASDGSSDSDIDMTGSPQLITNGISVQFGSTTGHSGDELWEVIYICPSTSSYINTEHSNFIRTNTNNTESLFVTTNTGTGTEAIIQSVDDTTNTRSKTIYRDNSILDEVEDFNTGDLTRKLQNKTNIQQSIGSSIFSQQLNEIVMQNIGAYASDLYNGQITDGSIDLFGQPVPFEGNISKTINGNITSIRFDGHIDVSSFASEPPGTYFAEITETNIYNTDNNTYARQFNLQLPDVFGSDISSGKEVYSGDYTATEQINDEGGTGMRWIVRIDGNGSDNRLFMSNTNSLSFEWEGSTIWTMPTSSGNPGDVMVLGMDGETLEFTPMVSGGSPGGYDGQIQFNNSGSFGGSETLSIDLTNREIKAGGTNSDSTSLKVNWLNNEINLNTSNGKFAAGDVSVEGNGTKIEVFDNGSQKLFVSSGFMPQSSNNVNIDRSGVIGLDDISISPTPYEETTSLTQQVEITRNNVRWIKFTNGGPDDISVGDVIEDSGSSEQATVLYVNYSSAFPVNTPYLITDSGTGAFTGLPFTVISGVNVGATGDVDTLINDTDTATYTSMSYTTIDYPVNIGYATSPSSSISFGSATGHTIGDTWIITYSVASTTGLYIDYRNAQFQFGMYSGTPGYNNPKALLMDQYPYAFNPSGTVSISSLRMGSVNTGGTVLSIGASGADDDLLITSSNATWVKVSPDGNRTVGIGDLNNIYNGTRIRLDDTISQTIFDTGVRMRYTRADNDMPWTILQKDYYIIGEVISDRVYTLPLANAVGAGATYIIKNINTSTGDIILTPDTGDYINGTSSLTITPGNALSVFSNGVSGYETF